MTRLVHALVALLAVFACQGGPSPRASVPASSGVTPAPPASAASPASVPAAAPAAAPPRVWPPAPPGVTSDFCVDGVDALDEETCYVLPDAPPSELLLYLHGIVPPTPTSIQKTRFETVVANASRRGGVAALMPRGRRGLAPKGRDGWWGWPTSAELHRRLAPELVRGFAEKRAKLEALTGLRFARLYVAGSSSGAYFAAALALHADIEADAFGAMSGGAVPALARLDALAPKPFYVGFGRHDTVAPGARSLATALERAGWPVRLAVHPLSHGAQEIYLDEALAFFRERLALTTPSAGSP